MNNMNSLSLISNIAERNPHSIAILAPGEAPITYSRLLDSVRSISEWLRTNGLDRRHRTALILKDGPEMAILFLGISSIMACAPLNPNYTSDEYRFYLSDLRIDAVIVQDGLLPAIEAAQAIGAKVIPLSQIIEIMEQDGSGTRPEQSEYTARNEDIALLLHTSGTTSKPKIVPITHANIYSSIRYFMESMRLTEADRCLNASPLFHVHGLVVSLLSSLAAGGSVVCSRGFSPQSFYESLERFAPTWYTAVPTVHQSILAHARMNPPSGKFHSLRFVRSSSAVLDSQVADELERLYQVPVLAGYGMTEATGQITVNPLPPGKRVSGSVGRPVGCELAVMDPNGAFVEPGTVGEIVVRGPIVMGGYENNPEANRNSFVNGWFRTGDLGYLDSDGYLFIKGRVKEIINRGGEKIMPAEVEEVILRHPSVMQAAAFSYPHPTLGEDIAVIIVPQPGQEVSEAEIRRFAAARLAEFKVPAKVVVADKIPKGPTGKIQRFLLADKLGLGNSNHKNTNVDEATSQSQRSVRGPLSNTESKLMRVWSKLLGTSTLDVTDNFFELGGNSLLATQLMTEINMAFKRSLPASMLYQENTIEKLAKLIDSTRSDLDSQLVAIQPYGDQSPLFCVHDMNGDVVHFWNLATELGTRCPLYGLRISSDDVSQVTIEQLAASYLREIRKIQPEGPYYLLGYSLGGTIAYEMAMQLREQSEDVSLLAMIDSSNPKHIPNLDKPFLQKVFKNTKMVLKTPIRHKVPLVLQKIRNILIRMDLLRANPTERAERRAMSLIKAVRSYRPRPYPGKFVYFGAVEQLHDQLPKEKLGWESTLNEGIDVYKIRGDHGTIIAKQNMEVVARCLKNYLGLGGNKMFENDEKTM